MSVNKNIVIITARGGSQSIVDKNIANICDKPSIAYPILAAKGASHVDDVFVFTDCEKIADVAKQFKCRIIHRRPELCKADVNHGDAICAAIDQVRIEMPDFSNVTVLLGDTVMVNSALIDLSIHILEEAPQWDSVMSVWRASDDHPFRAMCLSENGGLESFLKSRYGESAIFQTARQSYPVVYFYDQGIWTFRHDVPKRKEGPSPWWWMGKNVFPIVRRWIAGRDYHSPLDLAIAEWWVNSGQEDVIENLNDIRRALNPPAP